MIAATIPSEQATKHHWNGILDSAADAVGNTPLINLSRFAASIGVKCNILAKVEFFSAGGSIKDRIAHRMITQAEHQGLLVPGQSVIIEPTSGNTGIGLALLAGLRGYRCIITLPDKMSKEKEAILKGLGAEVVRTRTEAGWEEGDSHIEIAKRLAKEIPGGIILDQYNNIHNPLAHYHSTFSEIKHSLSTSSLPTTQIHALVAGAGTGGTITGLSLAMRDEEQGIYPRSVKEAEGAVRRYMDLVEKAGHGDGDASDAAKEATEEKRDERKGWVVACDPVGSILGGGDVGNYVIEGIGYDFVPHVLDRSPECIDAWIKVNDEDAFGMVRKIMQTESLLIGGSSGSALSGLYKFLTQHPEGKVLAQEEGKNVVVLLPDGVRNYISKDWFLDPLLKGERSDLGKDIENVLGRKMGDAKGRLKWA